MIVFHIGYPKAASSTFLRFLNEDPSINYIGRHRSDGNNILKLINSIMNDTKQDFYSKLNINRELLNSYVNKDLLNVFSDGEFLNPLENRNILNTIDRIILLTEKKCKIFLILREQIELIESFYAFNAVYLKKKKQITNVNQFIKFLINSGEIEYYNFNNFYDEKNREIVNFFPLKDLIKLNSNSQLKMKNIFETAYKNEFSELYIHNIFQQKINVTNSSRNERYFRIDDQLSNLIVNNKIYKLFVKVLRNLIRPNRREFVRKIFTICYIKLLHTLKFFMIIFKLGRVKISDENKKNINQYFMDKNRIFFEKINQKNNL